MRTLYVLRHAKSSWDDTDGADFDRGLAPRGVRDAKRLGAHFHQEKIRPGLVVCSPAQRTRDTLAALSISGAEVRFDDVLYGADHAELVAIVRALPDECKSALLIGHNPGLSNFVGDSMPTAALATIELTSKNWSDWSATVTRLTDLVRPKELPD